MFHKWGAAGRLKDHLIPFSASCLMIASSFSPLNVTLSSLAAATKFVPLSDSNASGCPLQDMNLFTASREAAVFKLSTSSKSTARTPWQVNEHTHFFVVLLKSVTSRRPKLFTPQFVKARTRASTLLWGISLIFGKIAPAFLLHVYNCVSLIREHS